MAAAALLAGVSAHAAPAGPIPGEPFHVEVVQLESDPPGDVRSAPGGGRTLAPAMLYTPATGENPHGPALLMLDDGPGSHPLAADQAARFAAEALAAAGYTVLSPYTGEEHNFPLVRFADNRWAVKSAIDFLEHAGFEDIVIVGQGYGAITAADYLKELPDRSLDNGPERRVKALVMINPALEPTGYPGFGSTAGVAQREAEARKLVADGTGLFPGELEPGHNIAGAQANWFMQGRYSQPAQGWLEYWSTDARKRNRALATGLPVPVLVLAGSQSAMAPATAVADLGGPDVTIHTLPDIGNDVSPVAATIDRQIADWLNTHGLATRPAVITRAVDVTLPQGQRLFGLEYDPATPPPPDRPVVMLISGRTGDTLESSTHWMGWRIAQQGYRVLAPSMRISGVTGIQTETIAHTHEDIARWIDFAETGSAPGHPVRIVLGGHSNGGIWISSYEANRHDPRVAGMIYFAPTVDAEAYKRQQIGDRTYEQQNAFAYNELRAGRRDTMMGLESVVAFSELYGSHAGTEHSRRVSEFRLPGLAIVGGKDPLMSDWFLKRFTAGYAGPLKLVRYDNGTHGFRENKDRLGHDVAAWLEETFR